ncbi:hypothetical protein K449DRAFT_403013 [Hypoxylon sp. EC38]|nr:hypothetical protein K449DRAFT_403013 [Hypoxylon sp. EC38]
MEVLALQESGTASIAGFRDAGHPDNPNVTISYFAQRSLTLTLVAGFAMYFAKTPILVLYLKLFGIKTWLRVASYATLTLSFIIFLITLSIAGAACSQTSEVDMNFLEKCITTSVSVGVSNGATAVITDIIVIILPLPIIAGLELPLPKKIGLAIVFLTGIFAIAASAISLYFKAMSLAGHSTALAPTLFCTIIECSLAIMVGCAPALRSCWAKYGKKVQSALVYFRTPRSMESHKPEGQDYMELP